MLQKRLTIFFYFIKDLYLAIFEFSQRLTVPFPTGLYRGIQLVTMYACKKNFILKVVQYCIKILNVKIKK